MSKSVSSGSSPVASGASLEKSKVINQPMNKDLLQ